MGRFLTSTERIERYDDGLYIILDNMLYQDDDGTIYLVPRNFVTDNYSIPNWTAWVVGDSVERDLRPSWIHDFICAYHKAIKVNLTRADLINKGYYHPHYSAYRDRGYLVCEDIPKKYLELVPFSKGEANNLLGRAMEGLKVPKRKAIRIGVAFNFNWYWTKKPYHWGMLYEVTNHYDKT